MSAIPSRRRGACPGLTAPMQTGDGLLVRLANPGTTIGLDAATALCAAARRHGNGIIEVTARGSIQIRGLTAVSAPVFADAVAALDIDAGDGVPILTDPLAGIEPLEGQFGCGCARVDSLPQSKSDLSDFDHFEWRNRVDPTSRGEGSGVGVARCSTSVPHGTTPHPNPPPQGGRESTSARPQPNLVPKGSSPGQDYRPTGGRLTSATA
jgi:nitrite/sulfite reductase ferredoxin-like protein